MKSEIFW